MTETFDPSTIQAVAFDGYGTLFDFTDADFRVALSTILAEQGLEADHDAFFKTWIEGYGRASVWGASREDGRPDPELTLNGPLPEWHSTWEIWRRQFGNTFAHFGLEGDGDAAASHLRALLSEAPTYPDAYDTIEGLARGGYLLGLLSNADEDFLQSALSRGRLRFSVIQSSESLRAYKPHRAIFAALCTRLGCAPEAVLYVGDSARADVRGARNAGLRTAWVRRSETTYPDEAPTPDITIDGLAELLPLLVGER